MKRVLSYILIFFSLQGYSQITLQKVEPPFWWTGFKNPELQLMVYGKDISKTRPSVNYPGVELKKVNTTNNPNYLFLDLVISQSAEPGDFPISFYMDGKLITEYLYELRCRDSRSAERTSFTSEDVIYLIMPDRFSNGDTTNDRHFRMREGVDRKNPDLRHGGDIKGITDHLDYIKDMGFTALWINPVQENNMGKYSYHGYSITDFYTVDRRLGSNDDFALLSFYLHKRGMKLIMDMVFNHCGSEHWWMKDLPSDDWIHRFPEFTRTSYRILTMSDPSVSSYDSSLFVKGWFDRTMPDLNQHNPFLAKYLIQNSIWWIEFAEIDGIRMDTYPYSYKDFMSEWGKAVLREYPDFNMVGECWLTQPRDIAYWQKGALNKDGFDSNLPSVFDFAMYDALRLAFMEKDEGNKGIYRLYDILSQDAFYPDPSRIVVFADNHDVNRYLDSQGDDICKLRMAMTFLLTSRGIPEIFYGTEVLLTTGKDKGDGSKRKDFPGGWKSDTINAFTGKGLSPDQADMQNYVKKLLNWRKNHTAVQTGRLKHFIPDNDVYVYFRYNNKETIMVVMNNHETEQRILDRDRFSEFLDKFTSATDALTGKKYKDLKKLVIQPKTAMIFELK